MSTSFDLTDIDRFVAGATGIPGARTFYLQVASGSTVLSFKCEKAHVDALSQALTTLLGDLPPVATDRGLPTGTSLSAPVLAEWSVGSIALGYEAPTDRIMVVLEEFASADDTEADADDTGGAGGQARFPISRSQAKTFAEAGSVLVRAGRPACPVCESPIDSVGYSCVCFN